MIVAAGRVDGRQYNSRATDINLCNSLLLHGFIYRYILVVCENKYAIGVRGDGTCRVFERFTTVYIVALIKKKGRLPDIRLREMNNGTIKLLSARIESRACVMCYNYSTVTRRNKKK